MMGSVVKAIEELGVQVEHIAGSCTYLCQPLDIGVNKPFKLRMQHLWKEWMIADGLLTGKTSPPTRGDVANWCSTVYKNLPEGIIQNSWHHGAYSFFPPPTGNN
jgi:hypothetical protein